ncbi:TPA: hypothetical protein N0F65_005883, partial [Lagenidium giganteum]
MVTEAKAFVQSYSSKNGLVGFAVGVVQDDKLVLAEGYGVGAKGNPQRNLDANTAIQIGSVTKTFVALALGILLHEATDTKKMTIADLLTMVSGFGDSQGDIAVDAGIVGSTERKVIANIEYLEPDGPLPGKKVVGQLRQEAHFSATAAFRQSPRDGHLMCGNNIHGPYDVVDSAKSNVGGIDDMMDAAGLIVSTLNDLGKFMRVVLNWGRLDHATVIVQGEKDTAVSADYGFDVVGKIFWGERYFDKASRRHD